MLATHLKCPATKITMFDTIFAIKSSQIYLLRLLDISLHPKPPSQILIKKVLSVYYGNSILLSLGPEGS